MNKAFVTASILLLAAVSGFSLTADEENLLLSAKSNNTIVLKELVKKGVNLNIKKEDGTTALMWASWNGRPEAVDALLNGRGFFGKIFKGGVEINAKNSTGITALMMSAGTNSWKSPERVKILGMLLKAGADVNIKDESGWNTLMAAAWGGNPEAVKLLLERNGFFSRLFGRGINLDDKNNYGISVLLLSAGTTGWDSKERLDTLSLLLNAGAKPDIRDRNGMTALMIASITGKIDAVRILLKAKADVNLQAPDSKTALLMAQGNKQDAVVELLKQHGAK